MSKQAEGAYPAKITAALHAVMAKVGYVQKKGTNTFHKYRYAGEADLLEVLRPAMVEAGLLLIPSGCEVRPVDEHGNTFVAYDYTLAHKDGDVWPEKVRAFGCGNDRNSKGGVGDKGVYKAATGANKYLLFKLFQIETGDDPEMASTADQSTATTNGGGPSKGAHGPRNITTLKKELQAFCGDLVAVTDLTELTAMLNERRDLLDQCVRDLPGWWYTKPDSDVQGIQDRIEDRRKDLEVTEQEREMA